MGSLIPTRYQVQLVHDFETPFKDHEDAQGFLMVKGLSVLERRKGGPTIEGSYITVLTKFIMQRDGVNRKELFLSPKNPERIWLGNISGMVGRWA